MEIFDQKIDIFGQKWEFTIKNRYFQAKMEIFDQGKQKSKQKKI